MAPILILNDAHINFFMNRRGEGHKLNGRINQCLGWKSDERVETTFVYVGQWSMITTPPLLLIPGSLIAFDE